MYSMSNMNDQLSPKKDFKNINNLVSDDDKINDGPSKLSQKFIVERPPEDDEDLFDIISIPNRPFPSHLANKNSDINENFEINQAMPEIPSIEVFLKNDPALNNNEISPDKIDSLIEMVEKLKQLISSNIKAVQDAENKRLQISSKAELIHGQCESQLSTEQRLGVFVKSIESILHYFDDQKRISQDFESPLFTVLAPDFPDNLKSIEDGLHFFEMNPTFKESKSYLFKYKSLQRKAADFIRDHVGNTLERITKRLSQKYNVIDEGYKNEMYVSFYGIAPTVKRLFNMASRTDIFGDVLSVYKTTRLNILNPVISTLFASKTSDSKEVVQNIMEIPPTPPTSVLSIEQGSASILTYARKEYELSKEFFDYNGHPQYSRTFSELASQMCESFYNLCRPCVINCSEVPSLSKACARIRSEAFQEEVGKIPVAGEYIRSWFNKLLGDAQERLLFKAEVMSSDIRRTKNYSEALGCLGDIYLAIPGELFSECASNILMGILDVIESQSEEKKKNDGDLSGQAFLLSKYREIIDSLKNFDAKLTETSESIDLGPLKDFFWGLLRFDGSAIRALSKVTPVIQQTTDARDLFESKTNMALHSIGTISSQILAQPLIQFIQSGSSSSSPDILLQTAINETSKLIDEGFKTKVADVITKEISDQGDREIILGIIREKFIVLVGDSVQLTKGNLNDETTNAIELINKKINSLHL